MFIALDVPILQNALHLVVKDQWTGSGICKRVTYILDAPDFVKEGFVIMGLAPWTSINHPGEETE